ncbi:MAG: aminopeptidase [Lachnospiraceae bacterium]|nr:aminopeptidase [Lachnospiraceae bacterium]
MKAQYIKGAKKLIENIGNVKSNEKVLIVSDYRMKDVAEVVNITVEAIGAECVLCYMKPREWDCQEPPAMIAAAMLAADVIMIPVSVSIAWTEAVRNAEKNGARVMLMTAFDLEIFCSDALLKTNFQKRAEFCAQLADVYDAGRKIRLFTEKGTDLVFENGGRKMNKVGPVPVKGECRAAPDIEINVPPLEGTANGVLVVDGSIPYLGIGVLDNSVKCIVKDGRIVDIEGGKEAEILRANLKSFQDETVYNIAEFGIGLNPNAKLRGNMLEDEGVFGTVHIGIGSSCCFGGTVSAPIHYDLIIKDVNIELDGKLVQSGKNVLALENYH